MSTKLSEHFTLAEMTRSQTAARHGIDNTPPPEVVANLAAVCNLLEDIRKLAGRPISVSSGYRGPKVNARVGGSKTSQHCKGEAADFDIIGMTTEAAYQLIKQSGLVYDQLIQEFGSWVHVSFRRDGQNRRQNLRAVRQGKKTTYIPE